MNNSNDIIDLEPVKTSLKSKEGFIDPKGNFYFVRDTMSKSKITHDMWAREYLEKSKHYQELLVSDRKTLFYSMFNSKTETLVNVLGFIYYSHDELLHHPIVLIPDAIQFHNLATKEQIDTLERIMELNNEDPNNNDQFLQIFNEELKYQMDYKEGRKKL